LVAALAPRFHLIVNRAHEFALPHEAFIRQRLFRADGRGTRFGNERDVASVEKLSCLERERGRTNEIILPSRILSLETDAEGLRGAAKECERVPKRYRLTEGSRFVAEINQRGDALGVSRDKWPGQADRERSSIDARIRFAICTERERQREGRRAGTSIENTLVSIPPIAIAE